MAEMPCIKPDCPSCHTIERVRKQGREDEAERIFAWLKTITARRRGALILASLADW